MRSRGWVVVTVIAVATLQGCASVRIEPAQAGKYSIPDENLKIPEEMQRCAANLGKIHAAIREYEKTTKKIPDWLSDLVPAYLTTVTLYCPNDAKHTSLYLADPKMPCSYSYEFSPSRYSSKAGTLAGKTAREWKSQQLKYFGDVVPMVRCQHHGDVILNLARGGQIYTSPLVWERMFVGDYRSGMEFSSGPGHYFKARAKDFLDITKVGVGWGLGAHADVEATALARFATGAGFDILFGLGEKKPLWAEFVWGFPFNMLVIPDNGSSKTGWREMLVFHSRIKITPSSEGSHSSLVPLFSTYKGGKFGSPLLDRNYPPIRWADVEAGATVGLLGCRVGVSPGQLLDFLVGWFGVDLAGDDIDHVLGSFGSYEPVPQPPAELATRPEDRPTTKPPSAAPEKPAENIEHAIQGEETLESIVKDETGSEKNVAEVREYNKIKLPEDYKSRKKIVIPGHLRKQKK